MKSLCGAAENWNTNGYTAAVNGSLWKLLLDGVIGSEDDRGPTVKRLKPVSPPTQQPDNCAQSP